MKNQYFGDINDYRKYGLLRAISGASGLRTLVAWMLTPEDGSTDGRFTKYLSEPEKWSGFDATLYSHLRHIMSTQSERKVKHIEETNLLADTEYFSEEVPDKAEDRNAWFALIMQRANSSNFVFLDPDNGLEVKSIPYGRKNSSKFLYWREVKALWESGKSLLIYQHFIREKRFIFIQRMLTELQNAALGSLVEAFSTPHVVFLMALQSEHKQHHSNIVCKVQEKWEGQIHHWELIRTRQL